MANDKQIWVLDGNTPEDVVRAMIENGQTEPFYLYNIDKMYEHLEHFKKMMPRVQIFYAMKANDWEQLLKVVIACGCGFDCASPWEIHKVRSLNINPASIIFAIPTKTKEQMIFARQTGVKHTTFDSSYELTKIKKYWPDAKLLIRIRVDGDSIYKLGEKFGCDYETEAIDLLEEAAALGLSVVGVAFHVGSACSSDDSYELGLRRAKELFEHEAKAGRSMSIVDIGGGFFSDAMDRIDAVAEKINKMLDELFPDPSIQVIAEPGRYICDTSADLYNSINNIRRNTDADKPIDMIYLDDGLHGTLRYIEPWHTVEKYIMKQNNNNIQNGTDAKPNKTKEVILWGPTCDSTDRVMLDLKVCLPECSVTDWLVFRIQGAYTWGFHGPFSSIPIPLARAVVSRAVWEKIKECPVFGPNDFLLNPDISKPLPSTLPPAPKNKHYSSKLQTPALQD